MFQYISETCVSKDKYLCKVHTKNCTCTCTCISFKKNCLNTSKTNKQTNKNRKTTEIIDIIVGHVHLFIIVYRV